MPYKINNPIIEVWAVEERHPYPWRYAVSFQGKRWVFAGIPNQCESIAEALMKAQERVDWMKDGSFSERYGNAQG